MSALDHVDAGGTNPAMNITRQRLQEKAASMGMRYMSVTVTTEPIPDPALDALPRSDLDRIIAIARDMYTRPEAHVDELERLAAKYPHIPTLRNHLAGALEASGQRKRAEQLIAQTAREFPTYLFAFCNYVMMLLVDGKVDEAREMVEIGARGPVLTLWDFDPTRDTFHISEAISHAAMVGHYMLATGRHEAAKVQLDILKQTAPESPQYRSLAAAMKRCKDPLTLMAAVLMAKAQAELRAERRAAKAKKQGAGTPDRSSAKPSTPQRVVNKRVKKPSESLGAPLPFES